MANAHDYAAILNVLVERAKEVGEANAGNDVALACYQLLESAASEAEVWGVPLAEIGLGAYDTGKLLQPAKRAAA